MPFAQSYLPYGAWWTTPFCRWQGALAREHSLQLAAATARRFFSERQLDPAALDGLFLGFTVPQRSGFYGAPWVAGMLGAPDVTGPSLSQACATSARVLVSAAHEVEAGQRSCVLALCADRTSNGPHFYFPDPGGPGGMGKHENPVWDSFSRDPYAGAAMIATAENVAAKHGITREEQDAMALLRHEQYHAAAAERAQTLFPVHLRGRKGKVTVVDADEGIVPTDAEGLARLRPVQEDGTVTFGSQTHPADGNAGMLVCDRATAAAHSRDPAVTVQVLGYGEGRVEKAHMPMATVPAARAALAHAEVALADCDVVCTHNPFALNDVYFCRSLELDPERVNRRGSPLVYGHPQAPTGMRAMIEALEQLVARGGGTALFSGCAAGDTAMAVVLRVR